MKNTDTADKIPYDELKKLLFEAQNILAQKEKEVQDKNEQILQLSFELDKFRKYLFGQKNEKFPGKEIDLGQMNLFDLSMPVPDQESLSEQAVAHQGQEEKDKKPPKKRAKGTGRMALPEELPREEVRIEPDEDVSGCKCIGEEITEVLDVTPAQLKVIKYVRPKYAANGKIITATLPERVVNKGIPSNRLVAQMILDKYVYGLPLHRQIDKYRRLGVNIPASTASDWMIKGWKYLAPLWELLQMLIIQQKYLQVDESPIKVQDRDHKHNIHKGYMWVCHSPPDKLVLYNYSKGRDKSALLTLLGDGFQGILQCDGYTVYESLYSEHKEVILVHCMAHARRKFVDALKYDEEKASYVLNLIQQLYLIEKEMKEGGLEWQQRTTTRQEQAVPILHELEQWLKKHALTVLPKSPLGQAINYTLPRWKGLSAYAQHGQIEIDNNGVENAIRPLAVGRKNYLFAGSHEAAQMTAAMYSFMATCKKNGVDELEWLTDVFDSLQNHKHKDLYQLLPNNWEKYKDQSK